MNPLLALLTMATLSGPVTAQEQPRCGRIETALQMLLDKYGETPAFVGNAGTATFIVTLNPQTATWTMLIQPNKDVACIATSGENWQGILPGKGT